MDELIGFLQENNIKYEKYGVCVTFKYSKIFDNSHLDFAKLFQIYGKDIKYILDENDILFDILIFYYDNVIHTIHIKTLFYKYLIYINILGFVPNKYNVNLICQCYNFIKLHTNCKIENTEGPNININKIYFVIFSINDVSVSYYNTLKRFTTFKGFENFIHESDLYIENDIKIALK